MIKLYELIAYTCLICALTAAYFACFDAAASGYGYPGYRGYHTHHSHFWYHANYDQSYYPSVRENSANGNRFSKRGLSGGK